MDRAVGIEIAHDLEQLVLRGGSGQLDLARKNAEFAAGADFRSDIHMRGRIIADQHDRESRHQPVARAERRERCYLDFAQLFRHLDQPLLLLSQ